MICAVQETDTGGTFWAGGIVLAGVDVDDSVGHLSSGFEVGGLGHQKCRVTVMLLAIFQP